MAISFSLFCGSCGKGMSPNVGCIEQKSSIELVLLTEWSL